MSQHAATIIWQRESADFTYESYNRSHQWHFENGIVIEASAAVAFRGTPDRLDPEEAFVASLSSCHMLTFLAICARRHIGVDSYQDKAIGFLENNSAGKLAITRVELSPLICFAGEPPTATELHTLHQRSHHDCFIANSVRTEILVKPAPGS